MGADFNLLNIHCENSEIKGYNYKKQIKEKFPDTSKDSGPSQIVDKPICGENSLDIFLTNWLDLIKSRNIVPGIGDHHEPASRTKRYRRSIDSGIKLILITSRKKFKKSLTASLKHTPLLILQMSSRTVSEITR